MLSGLFTLPVQLVCQLVLTQENSTIGNVSFENSIQGNITYGNTTFENATFGTQLPKSTQDLPEGYIAFPAIAVAYKYFQHKRTWNAARKHCIEEGGQLAGIDSFKKIEYIMGIKKTDQIIHAGIHRLYDVAEWTSVKTTLPITVKAWAPSANLATAAGPCTYMFADGRGLHPGACTSQYSFVCEISLLSD